MGNEQTNIAQTKIPTKVENALKIFHQKLLNIPTEKEQRALILECRVSSSFTFDLSKWINIARYVLEKDSIIANIRQKIVPSLIKEDEFWKRYFYLVKIEKNKQKSTKIKKDKIIDKKDDKKDDNNNKNDDDKDDEPYQLLLQKDIIWLYRIPGSIWRGRNNKCALWNLRKPIFQGRLRIIAYNHGRDIVFQFLEKDGKIFLKSTKIHLNEINDDNPIHSYFDAYGVMDSSRYFIIWVDLPAASNNDKRIPFGFGIRERQDAFDIRACVADQMKIIKREFNQNNNDLSDMDDDDGVIEYEWITDDGYNPDDNGNMDDDIERKCVDIEIEMDDNQNKNKKMKKKWLKKKHSTILKININDNNDNSNNDNDNNSFLLPPPPSPPSQPALTAQLTPTDQLNWGDFQSASNHQNIGINDNNEKNNGNDANDDVQNNQNDNNDQNIGVKDNINNDVNDPIDVQNDNNNDKNTVNTQIDSDKNDDNITSNIDNDKNDDNLSKMQGDAM